MASFPSQSSFHDQPMSNSQLVCFFRDDLTRYLSLHVAILQGDLGWVRSICDSDQHAKEARITVNLDTALHVAVGTGMAIDIVEHLLNRMSPDQIALKNIDGNTVLSIAAISGNMEAAKLLVEKDDSLNGVKNNSGWIPLILAAQHKQKEMIDYLLPYSGIFFMPDGNFSTDTICVFFMNSLIDAEFYDLALELQRCYPNLATMMSSDGDSLLKALAGKPSSFSRGRTPQFMLHELFMQMQHELQCFEEVKNIVHPRFIDDKNYEGKTPAMVFSEEHKELVKEGEQWMKSAATSSSVAAALIATVVFAAAIAVPGDYDNDGTPNFKKREEFTVFAISDTISMFSSLAAIIMFLSIFTSRYAQDDFLVALPMKLIQCLLWSLLSVFSTAVAFAYSAYLVFWGKNSYGSVVLAVAVYLLTLLGTSSQVPLLVQLLFSTIGRGNFRKQTNMLSTK